MGQSRPLFVYFRLFHITQFNKLMKRRWCAWDLNPGSRMEGEDKSTVLWRHPTNFCYDRRLLPSFSRSSFYDQSNLISQIKKRRDMLLSNYCVLRLLLLTNNNNKGRNQCRKSSSEYNFNLGHCCRKVGCPIWGFLLHFIALFYDDIFASEISNYSA